MDGRCGGELTPRLGLFVEGEKPLDDRGMVAGFVGQGTFVTEGDDGARVSLALRAGLHGEAHGWSLFADGQLRRRPHWPCGRRGS